MMDCLKIRSKRRTSLVPVTTVLVDSRDASGILIKTRNCISEHLPTLKATDKLLEPELFMINRQIYRCSGPFRSDKMLSRMRQLYKILTRYNEVKIVEAVESILETLTKSGLQEIENKLKVPSKMVCTQLLHNVLGASSILHRAIHFCFEVRIHVEQQLWLGHYVLIMMLYYALVSRIWILCRSALMKLVTIYGKFKEFMAICENSYEEEIKTGAGADRLPADLQHLYPNEGPVADNTSDSSLDDLLAGYRLKAFGIEEVEDDELSCKDVSTILDNFKRKENKRNSLIPSTKPEKAGDKDVESIVDFGIRVERSMNHTTVVTEKVASQVFDPELDIGIRVQRPSEVEIASTHSVAKKKKLKKKKPMANVSNVTYGKSNEDIAQPGKPLFIGSEDLGLSIRMPSEIEVVAAVPKSKKKKKLKKDATEIVYDVEKNIGEVVTPITKSHISDSDMPVDVNFQIMSEGEVAVSKSKQKKKKLKKKKIMENINKPTDDITIVVPPLVQSQVNSDIGREVEVVASQSKRKKNKIKEKNISENSGCFTRKNDNTVVAPLIKSPFFYAEKEITVNKAPELTVSNAKTKKAKLKKKTIVQNFNQFEVEKTSPKGDKNKSKTEFAEKTTKRSMTSVDDKDVITPKKKKSTRNKIERNDSINYGYEKEKHVSLFSLQEKTSNDEKEKMTKQKLPKRKLNVLSIESEDCSVIPISAKTQRVAISIDSNRKRKKLKKKKNTLL